MILVWKWSISQILDTDGGCAGGDYVRAGVLF